MNYNSTCEFCGKPFYRRPSHLNGKHSFCSQACSYAFKSRDKNPDGYGKRPDTSERNRVRNVLGQSDSTRQKLRDAKASIVAKEGTYKKRFGRHEHRVVAEEKLGRPLREGEVVHHIDGDKHNNNPDNLMVFASQYEHAKWHAEHKRG